MAVRSLALIIQSLIFKPFGPVYRSLVSPRYGSDSGGHRRTGYGVVPHLSSTILRTLRPLGNQSGFTLMELLAGIFIMVIGVWAFSSLNISTNKSKIDQEKLNIAVGLAQEQIELQKVLKSSLVPQTIDEEYNTIPGSPEFRRRTVITTTGGTPAMLRVTVTVFWRQNSKSYILETLL